MTEEPPPENAGIEKEDLISDLRRASRYDSVNLLWYESADPEDAEPARGIGNTQNISTGGLCIRTTKPLQEGRKYQVEIFTRLERKIKTICEVTYVTSAEEHFYTIGMKFVAISRADLDYLRDRFPAESAGE
jgi:hypothetical protein